MSVHGYGTTFPTGGYGAEDMSHQLPPPQPTPRIRGNGMFSPPVSCYGCGDPLTAKAIVTSCDCTFCEGCMSHFMVGNDACPSCGTQTTSESFSEVAIVNFADEAAFDKNHSVMDAIFTVPPGQTMVTLDQMAKNLIGEYEKHEKRTNFVICQLSKQAFHDTMQSRNSTRTTEKLKADFQRVTADNAKLNNKYRQEMARLNGQLADKERQLAHYVNGGSRGSSAGSHGRVSTSSRGSNHRSSTATTGMNNNHGRGSPASQAGFSIASAASMTTSTGGNAFQTFQRQKEIQERAQAQAVLSRRRPVVGKSTVLGTTAAGRSPSPLPISAYPRQRHPPIQTPVSRGSGNRRGGAYPPHSVPANYAPQHMHFQHRGSGGSHHYSSSYST